MVKSARNIIQLDELITFKTLKSELIEELRERILKGINEMNEIQQVISGVNLKNSHWWAINNTSMFYKNDV